MRYRLGELIKDLAILEVIGSLEQEICGLTDDSRKVEKGALFVALRGSRQDGHHFIGQAEQRGASAIVMERPPEPFDPHPGITYVQVADSRQALAQLAARFYSFPSHRLSLIGITGTNGKTTISYLTRSILEAAGHRVGLIGTISYRWGNQERTSNLTTPGAIELQALLHEMVEEGMEYVIMEVSSHALSLRRVDGCSFDIAVFTNLTGDHLDFHITMEDYFASKKRLFSELNPSLAIINRDDPWGRNLLGQLPAHLPSLTYGLHEPLDASRDLWADSIQIDRQGISLVVHTPKGPLPLYSNLLGEHNLSNILASVAIATQLGISPEQISRGVRELQGIPGRLERVGEGDFLVLVDYAHTPDALKQVLLGLRRMNPARLITIFGCGGNRDRTKRPMMGELAARYSDLLIITSDNPREEDPLAIIEEIERGVRRVMGRGGDRCEIVPDRREAIFKGISYARSGDIILIAGKGHETYQIIGGRTVPFDDREVAREALQARGDGRYLH